MRADGYKYPDAVDPCKLILMQDYDTRGPTIVKSNLREGVLMSKFVFVVLSGLLLVAVGCGAPTQEVEAPAQVVGDSAMLVLS